MDQQRQFRGVWIPKEIWLNKELTQQEKAFLIEIDSLEDEEKGCWASNKHFQEIFNVSSSHCSRTIQNLKNKGYIKIEYDRKGKEIETRHIFINRPPYPERIGMSKMDIGMTKTANGVCPKWKGGYDQNCKENNTYINNTINNNKENNKKKEYYENEELNNLFYEFLEVRKKLKAINSEKAINMLLNKLAKYDDKIKIEMIEKSIVNSWKDVYELKEVKNNSKIPEWFDKEIKKEIATKNQKNEIEKLLQEYK